MVRIAVSGVRSSWEATAAKSRAEYLLVPDVRFTNEANVCDYVVGIERPGLAAVEAHASEADIPELVRRSDYAVLNNGTLDQLQFEAGVLVRLLKEGVASASPDSKA